MVFSRAWVYVKHAMYVSHVMHAVYRLHVPYTIPAMHILYVIDVLHVVYVLHPMRILYILHVLHAAPVGTWLVEVGLFAHVCYTKYPSVHVGY